MSQPQGGMSQPQGGMSQAQGGMSQGPRLDGPGHARVLVTLIDAFDDVARGSKVPAPLCPVVVGCPMLRSLPKAPRSAEKQVQCMVLSEARR